MKKLITITCILLCLLSFSSRAQYVAIPDSNFCHWLKNNGYAACMSMDKLDTTCSTVLNSTGISCSNNNINNLYGIQFFKKLKVLVCSNNQLTSLPHLSDSLTKLICAYNQLTSLPALSKKVTQLSCYYNQLTTLPILPGTLTDLEVTSNKLTSLPALPNALLYLYCDSNQIVSLPTLPTSLSILSCRNNALTSLPTTPAGLSTIDCANNQLTSLPSSIASIGNLNCDNNKLTTLPSPLTVSYLFCDSNQLTSLSAQVVYYLSCSHNQLTSLPAIGKKVSVLICDYNQLTSLPALPINVLGTLSCSHNQLNALPNDFSAISTLICSYNQLTSLPPLTGGYLDSIDCSYNQLTSLPAMIFPTNHGSLICGNNPNLTCLPVLPWGMDVLNYDSTSITCVPNRVHPSLTNLSSSNVSTIPLCTNTLSSGCPVYWNISGNVHQDTASTCASDSLNPGANCPHYIVQLWRHNQIQQRIYTSYLGLYSFNTFGYDTFRVSIDTAGVPASFACPITGSREVIVSQQDSTLRNINFGVQCRGVDLGVSSIYGRFKPGKQSQISINAGDMSQFYALGCTDNVSGTLTTVLSGAATYVQAAPGALTPSSVSGNTLTYTVSDFGTVNFYKAFNIIVQTDSSATTTSQVCVNTYVSKTLNDVNLFNDTLFECFNVLSSADPNEKTVYPAHYISNGQWLTYTISFQNTGTDTATDIIVRDTLNANLNANTFTFLESSKNVVIQQVGNVIIFTFVKINLPDSVQNEAASHGWIQFKVQPNANLPLGTIITNKASVYFDLNKPVATNTVSNMVTPLSVPVVKGINSTVKLYPNPANETITIALNNALAAGRIQITDITGRVVYTAQFSKLNNTLDVSAFSNGMYIYNVYDGDMFKASGKFAIQR